MSYSYQPKDPKAKLRQVVIKYMTVMEGLGKAPNCSIAFAAADGSTSSVTIRAWLLNDTRPGSAGYRYVLLPDGDVWSEVEAQGATAGAAGGATAGVAGGATMWMNGPQDDLVTLLARSQASVRTGGDGFLGDDEHIELGGAAHVVADRRTEPQSHPGPERRTPR